MIYLDNAATSFPKPQGVLRRIYNTQAFFGVNPSRGGYALARRANEEVFHCRQALSKLFSCESENVCFSSNCTSALNSAINGLVKKGDHVVISSLEHNSVLRPVHALSEKGIISYTVAEVDPFDDERTAENFSFATNENTSLIIATLVSNVFGTVLPIKKIADLCKTKGILFIVDGAQGVPSHKISVGDGVSVLCLPGHKGLLGPMGTGVLVFDKNIKIRPSVFGGTGSASLSPSQPENSPEALESGTLNLSGIAGLDEGVKFIRRFGGEKAVFEKESGLIRILKEDLSVIKNVKTYSYMHGERNSTVLSFNINGLHSEQTAHFLDKNGICVRSGYHCSFLAHKTYGTTENGTVRVSPGIFNTKKDIKNLVFCLNKIALKENLC